MIARIWEAFVRNDIIRAVLTLGTTGVTLYLWVAARSIPKELLLLTGWAWGSYFPSKQIRELTDGLQPLIDALRAWVEFTSDAEP